jgi:hypothetical protein
MVKLETIYDRTKFANNVKSNQFNILKSDAVFLWQESNKSERNHFNLIIIISQKATLKYSHLLSIFW